MSSLQDWIRLHLAGLYHPEATEALLERHEGPAEIFKAAEATRGGKGLLFNETFRKKLTDPVLKARAREEISLCQRRGVAILLKGSSRWPRNLVGLPLTPLILFCLGEWKEGDGNAIAVVGSRRPTPYGLRQARRFAGALAGWGVTIVSGLARGIDGEAHRAALKAEGRTIAVLGSGLGRVYPRENRDLALSILKEKQGLLITEFPWGTAPLKHHFPQRNRILSGLAQAVLVVEAGEKSGSLLTVDWALKQGRQVFVIPGRVDQPEARGCVRLIQNGAHPVLDPEEVAESIFPSLTASLKSRKLKGQARKSPSLETQSDPFLQRLLPLFAEEDAWHPDALAERLQVNPGTLLSELARLEGDGRLRRIAGGLYILEET